MRTAKIVIYALACLSLSAGTIFSEPAAAITARNQSAIPSAPINDDAHIVVLQYRPGDHHITVRAIDGIETTQALAVPRPLLHIAGFYTGFVLLATAATYFRNAELLSVVSLAGIPILAIVTIRDLSKLMQGVP